MAQHQIKPEESTSGGVRSARALGRRLRSIPILFLLMVLVSVGVIYVFSDRQTNQDEQLTTITVGEPAAGLSLTTSYQPVASHARQSLLQSMAEFRAAYKQLQPDILFRFEEKSPTTRKITDNLNIWLNRNQLQTGSRPMKSNLFRATQEDNISLYHSPGENNYARQFAEHLAPYINGTVNLLPLEILDPGEIRIIFPDQLMFDSAGNIYFTEQKSTSLP